MNRLSRFLNYPQEKRVTERQGCRQGYWGRSPIHETKLERDASFGAAVVFLILTSGRTSSTDDRPSHQALAGAVTAARVGSVPALVTSPIPRQAQVARQVPRRISSGGYLCRIFKGLMARHAQPGTHMSPD